MKKILVLIIIISLFTFPLLFKSTRADPSDETDTENPSCKPLLIQTTNATLPIEEYLIGVLAGEMPASFHLEALKAQAIAARTYVIKQTDYGKKPIQTTTAHQVFNDETSRKQKWQTAFAEHEQKLTQAVEQTAHQILTYNEQPITAMFHAASHKQTESAENYSGNSIPYLTATSSPEQTTGEQAHYSYDHLAKKLQHKLTKAQLQKAKLHYNDTNRVEQITIGKKTWSGREFRTLLDLRSTYFTWQPTAKGITITTYGYGHGVGLSQYGANTMAQNGSTAEQILAHYYPTTTLESLNYCEK